VQAIGRRRADLDPRLQIAAQVALDDRRLLVVGHAAAAELDAVGVLERARDHAGDQVALALRGVLRDAEVELFVDLAIGVGEGDLELAEGRGQRHGASLLHAGRIPGTDGHPVV